MNLKNFAIPGSLAISIIIIAVVGGMTWGQSKQRLDSLEGRAEKQELVGEKVQEIWREQGVLKNKIENLSVQQREFHNDTKRSIERVLQYLRTAR